MGEGHNRFAKRRCRPCGTPRERHLSIVNAVGRFRAATFLAVVCVTSALAVTSLNAAAATCPNEATRAESNVDPATGRPYSTELPDCRAYELVTSEKDDYDAFAGDTAGSYALIAGDGGSLAWDNPYAGPYALPSNGLSNVYRAVRDAGECVASATSCWRQSTLAPEGVGGSESFDLAGASSDLATVIFDSVRTDEPGSLAPVGVLASGFGTCCATVAAGIPATSQSPIVRPSSDGSHVFFQTKARLLPEDTHGPINAEGEAESNQVYEWTRTGGLRLAGVDSESNPASPCGASLIGRGLSKLSSHNVSSAGSRMLFLSPDPRVGSEPVECRLGPVVEGKRLYVSDLYLRESYTREDGETAFKTIEISKPPAGVADYGAEFVGAPPSGSKVFFVSERALTPDKAQPGNADLYEYDPETAVLRRLSVGQEEADLTGFTGALASSAITSADGSHVYFTALGRLVPGSGKTRQQNEEACAGQGPAAPACSANLYEYSNGRVSLIATIEQGQEGNDYAAYQRGSRSGPPLAATMAAVTPDGSDLVFDSTSSLTAYDSEGNPELYRYDEANNAISCVSCNPTGGRAEGLPLLHASPPALKGLENQGAPIEQVGGLSSDGATVLFAATGRLLPAAVNVDPNAEVPVVNVYEWRNGVLSLISTGTSASADVLLGASADGSDIFFATASQLVGQDGDHSVDIYDARVAGGFPAPPAPAVSCASTETCRSILSVPPTPVIPASVSASGAGNVLVLAANPSSPRSRASRKPKLGCQARARRITKAARRRRALRRCLKPKRRGSAVAPGHRS